MLNSITSHVNHILYPDLRYRQRAGSGRAYYRKQICVEFIQQRSVTTPEQFVPTVVSILRDTSRWMWHSPSKIAVREHGLRVAYIGSGWGRKAQCGYRIKRNWTKTAHNTHVYVCIRVHLGFVMCQTSSDKETHPFLRFSVCPLCLSGASIL